MTQDKNLKELQARMAQLGVYTNLAARQIQQDLTSAELVMQQASTVEIEMQHQQHTTVTWQTKVLSNSSSSDMFATIRKRFRSPLRRTRSPVLTQEKSHPSSSSSPITKHPTSLTGTSQHKESSPKTTGDRDGSRRQMTVFNGCKRNMDLRTTINDFYKDRTPPGKSKSSKTQRPKCLHVPQEPAPVTAAPYITSTMTNKEPPIHHQAHAIPCPPPKITCQRRRRPFSLNKNILRNSLQQAATTTRSARTLYEDESELMFDSSTRSILPDDLAPHTLYCSSSADLEELSACQNINAKKKGESVLVNFPKTPRSRSVSPKRTKGFASRERRNNSVHDPRGEKSLYATFFEEKNTLSTSEHDAGASTRRRKQRTMYQQESDATSYEVDSAN
jgi:hypothetical protein